MDKSVDRKLVRNYFDSWFIFSLFYITVKIKYFCPTVGWTKQAIQKLHLDKIIVKLINNVNNKKPIPTLTSNEELVYLL